MKIRKNNGFTLLELLVAMGLSSMLVGMVIWQLSMVQKATKTNSEHMNVTQQILGVNQRIRADIAGMLGPSHDFGGALVIIPGLRKGIYKKDDGTQIDMLFRSDQLAFLYATDAPYNTHKHFLQTLSLVTDLFDIDADGDTGEPAIANHGRIWIGHIDIDENSDSDATQWVLGRHALLMLPGKRFHPPALQIQNSPQTNLPADDFPSPDIVYSSEKNTLESGDTLWLSPLKTLHNHFRQAAQTYTALNTSEQLSGQQSDMQSYYAKQMAWYTPDQHLYQPPQLGPTNLQPTTIQDLTQSINVLLTHCSEIVIQFAGDLDGNGHIDTLGNHIRWYPSDADVINGIIANPIVFTPFDAVPYMLDAPQRQGDIDQNGTSDHLTANRYGHYFPDAYTSLTNQWDIANNHDDDGDWQIQDDINHNGIADIGDTNIDEDATAYQALLARFSQHEQPGIDDNGNGRIDESGELPAWMNTPSGWPYLLRIRLRLHGQSAFLHSRNDSFLTNARDDNGNGLIEADDDNDGRYGEYETHEPNGIDLDGDGIFNEPASAVDIDQDGRYGEQEFRDEDEAMGDGVWYEIIVAIPYPMIE